MYPPNCALRLIILLSFLLLSSLLLLLLLLLWNNAFSVITCVRPTAQCACVFHPTLCFPALSLHHLWMATTFRFSFKRKVLILREKLRGGGNLIIIMLRNDTFVAAVTQYQLTAPTSLGLRSSDPSKDAILILVQQNWILCQCANGKVGYLISIFQIQFHQSLFVVCCCQLFHPYLGLAAPRLASVSTAH